MVFIRAREWRIGRIGDALYRGISTRIEPHPRHRRPSMTGHFEYERCPELDTLRHTLDLGFVHLFGSILRYDDETRLRQVFGRLNLARERNRKRADDLRHGIVPCKGKVHLWIRFGCLRRIGQDE